MSEKKETNRDYQFRAKLPLIFRGLAMFMGLVTILVIGIGFYWGSFRSEFRMKGLPTELSEDVVGEVVGYERRESEDGVIKYFLKADKATTYSDEHQELENVYLQVFNDGDEEDFDRISANKAIYVPADDGSKNFKIYFAGDVDIETRDELEVNTEQLTYIRATEIAEAEEAVKFSRYSVSGSSFGAVVNIKGKTLDLLKDVIVSAYPNGEDELSRANLERVKITANRAFIDQIAEKIKLEESVRISLTPQPASADKLDQPTDLNSDRATVYFIDKQLRRVDLDGNVDVYEKPTSRIPGWTRSRSGSANAELNKELNEVELFDDVYIETSADGSSPTRIRAAYAKYTNASQVFELKKNVEILTDQDSKKTRISAGEAFYDRFRGKVLLTGAAKVEQGNDVIGGDQISAELYSNEQLKFAAAAGSAFLKQKNAERLTEVTADELNASFNTEEELVGANAKGRSLVVVIPANKLEYSKFSLVAPKAINLSFYSGAALRTAETQGRTTIKLDSLNNSSDAANKTLTADKVSTQFHSKNKDLVKADAIGNAELVVIPLRPSPKNYKSTVKAPKFECDFYRGNNAKSCWSSLRSHVVREPRTGGKAKQTLEADRLIAHFDKVSKDVSRFVASGKAKFGEGDRNGIAERITYRAKEEIVQFRDGGPTVWNSVSRGKAKEIDWDVRNNKSEFRTRVSTTYFSQKQIKGSAPFASVNSPVFITANKANYDHGAETALYTGNARAWQGKNYVRANSLFLQQKEGQLFAKGDVNSLLYNVSRTFNGKNGVVPVFASAGEMLYKRDLNLIRYENKVDIRQGTDRIRAGIANIFLDSNNEVTRSVMERQVVITQPNRRASGDFAEYDVPKELVVLRGNPARVSDSESGSSRGREISVYLKENRVVGKGKTNKNSTGRIRSVYKIKKGKLN